MRKPSIPVMVPVSDVSGLSFPFCSIGFLNSQERILFSEDGAIWWDNWKKWQCMGGSYIWLHSCYGWPSGTLTSSHARVWECCCSQLFQVDFLELWGTAMGGWWLESNTPLHMQRLETHLLLFTYFYKNCRQQVPSCKTLHALCSSFFLRFVQT